MPEQDGTKIELPTEAISGDRAASLLDRLDAADDAAKATEAGKVSKGKANAAVEGGEETAEEVAAAEAAAAERDAELAKQEADAAADEAGKELTPEEEAEAAAALEAENAKRASELHTVVIDGKEEKVTLDEALKGYMRQRDYTQKTQHAAEVRKDADAELQQHRAARQQYVEGLEAITKTMKAIGGAEPDWATIRAERPNEYPILFADYQQKKEALATIQAEHDRVVREEAEDRLKQRAAAIASERAKFLEAVPEFGDPAKAPALATKLRETAKRYGFNPEDVDNTASAGLLRMLNDARQFHEIRAARKALADKRATEQAAAAKAAAAGKHPAAAPGGPRVTSKNSQATKAAMETLAAIGSPESAAAALDALDI